MVEQYSSSAKVAKKICDLLRKAEHDAAKHHGRQLARDLFAVKTAVVIETLLRNFTPHEGAELLKLIAKL